MPQARRYGKNTQTDGRDDPEKSERIPGNSNPRVNFPPDLGNSLYGHLHRKTVP